jgi:hypothetical protein
LGVITRGRNARHGCDIGHAFVRLAVWGALPVAVDAASRTSLRLGATVVTHGLHAGCGARQSLFETTAEHMASLASFERDLQDKVMGMYGNGFCSIISSATTFGLSDEGPTVFQAVLVSFTRDNILAQQSGELFRITSRLGNAARLRIAQGQVRGTSEIISVRRQARGSNKGGRLYPWPWRRQLQSPRDAEDSRGDRRFPPSFASRR